MSYIHKPHIQPLEYRAPFQLLRAHVAAHPNKDAFVFRDLKKNRVPITFQEYESTSQSIASGLLAIGVKRGDRVTLMLPSCPEFVFMLMALNRIGALAIVSEEDCIPDIKGVHKPSCVISKTDYSSSVGQQILHEIHSMLQEQKDVKAVLIGYRGDLLEHNRIISYKALLDMAKKNPESQNMLEQVERQVSMDDPFLIMFTSGSSGSPKAIEYTNHGFVNGCIKDALALKITRNTRMFNDSPFDWMPCMGFGIGVVITHGCTLIAVPPKVGFKGSFTSNILGIMAEEECSHCWLLPYFLHDVTLQGIPHGLDLAMLKYWSTGGQPLNMRTTRKLLGLLPEVTVINVYGSTETCILGTQAVNKDNIDSAVTGLMDVAPGYEMKIIDSHGQLVPIEAQGELCARAAWVCFPNLDIMRKLPKKSLKQPNNNWHHLCDCCSMTTQGQLKLFGRMDFLIKCATESIQPPEVEDVLYQHPDVDKVCVCGVPDQRLFQKICACVVMKAGKQGDQSSFDEWSAEKFPEMSLGLSLKPHYYLFLDSFPLTRTGKLCRRQTQEIAIKHLGLSNFK